MLTHITNPVETVRVLAISRDAATVGMLRALAEPHSWQVVNTDSAWDAMDALKTGLRPNFLVLDQPPGDANTLQIMRALRSVAPELPTIVICSQEDAGRNSKVHELGDLEVLVRPFPEQTLRTMLLRHLAPQHISSDFTANGLELLSSPFFVDGLVPENILEEAKLLADADVPVLISGEAGTGKSTVARLIHMLSSRSRFEFLTVECKKAPNQALEAELFGNGHTSRLERRAGSPGKVEWAEKGTILLEEVAELSADLQSRVMHLLQDKLRITYDGKAFPADVRILATTSADLDRAVIRGKLREDLHHRLTAFMIQIPPLRGRLREIPTLLEQLMQRLALYWRLPVRHFPATVIDACQEHSWPGNMQELESFVKRYLVLGKVDLSADADGKLRPARSATHPGIHEAAVNPPQVTDVETDSNTTSLKSLIRNIRSEAEQKAIRTALEKTGWNRKAAAQLLEVSYRTLLYKIEQYDIRSSETHAAGLQYAGSNGHGKRNGKAS